MDGIPEDQILWMFVDNRFWYPRLRILEQKIKIQNSESKMMVQNAKKFDWLTNSFESKVFKLWVL